RAGSWGTPARRTAPSPPAAAPGAMRAAPGPGPRKPCARYRCVRSSSCSSCRLELFADPVVALLLELLGELLAARAHDAPLREDVDEVRHEVVQEPLIVRDQDHRVVLAAQRIHGA